MLCKECSVTGSVSYFENQSPLGSGMVWNEEIIELCNKCTNNDICPSCGMFWKEQNKEFNQYCDGDAEEFGCIYCLWKSTDLPIIIEANWHPYTLDEIVKAPARRTLEYFLVGTKG